MAEKSSAEALARGVDLESGQSHTLELDGKLQLWLQLGDDVDGVELVVEDEGGREERRVPASQATVEQDGFRWFDLSDLPAGAHRVRCQVGDDAIGPALTLSADALDQSFAAADASGAADAFALAAPKDEDDDAGAGDDAGGDDDDSGDNNLDSGDDDATDPDDDADRHAALTLPDDDADANDADA